MAEHAVRKLYWEESERGWGVRPDGYSLHLTHEDACKFVDEYWATMPDGPAPDVYERPASTTTVEVLVDDETFELVKRSGSGIRRYR